MDQNSQQWSVPTPASEVRTDQVLERYYGQLVEWGTLLTRGDECKAQDLVHDFCLYFTLTQPDLSNVANLDGYLYKSLRHIYLSGLAQSSREALQFVNIAEFDSIRLALTPRQSGDPLQLQNDLRRICSYSVWRKDHTKGASYFILRYFHGYHHQEIAKLACTNIAAIYSKFRRFRIEIRSYLEEPGKLQFTNRELPPTPPQHWTPLSSADHFRELRKAILDARTGECLPEEELIALYSSEQPKPISCSLLSHIVSCERCLALIDSYLKRPTLKDREPLDEASDASDAASTRARRQTAISRERILRSVQRHKSEILDHRPRTLSIAIDGRILASHDVQAQQNVLSARIDHPENASFVEVFSEQGIRLAMLSIGDLPPEGPHGQTQRVALSDERWLDLTLSFDGLGLNSEVMYFDPALAPDVAEEEDSDAPAEILSRPRPRHKGEGNMLPWPRASAWLASIRRFLRPLTPSPVVAWSLVITCVFGIAGYFVLRTPKTVPTLSARDVLDRSIQVEAAGLVGQTEHEVFRFEEATADGSIFKQGTIDLWRDGDGKRLMRRLYDTRHRLIAAEWVENNGEHGEYQADNAHPPAGDLELLADDLWKQNISPDSFRNLNGENAQVRPTEDGYALTAQPGAADPQLISATLVLDAHFHPIREVLRMRNTGAIREVRYVEADYERRPSSSVPDAIFDPRDQGLRARADRHPFAPESLASDVQLTELHIAVLYQLSSLNADVNDPIEVDRTSDSHIRIAGMVASDDRRQEILSRLSLLDNHQLLEMQIVSPSDLDKRGKKLPRTPIGVVSMYDVGLTKPPADAALRTYFQAQALSGAALNDAVTGFSREALDHALRALQNASALKRLSDAFTPAELAAASLVSQQQWTEMVAKHATALEVELRALNNQLAILPQFARQIPNATRTPLVIDTPAQFARAANELFARTKSLDQSVSSIFASSQAPVTQTADIRSLINATRDAIPLQDAVELTSFSVQLNASGRTAAMNRQHGRPETQTPDRP